MKVIYIYTMKKLFLLPILLLVVSCSSNIMEESEEQQESATDPLIGIWLWLLDDPYSGNNFFDIEYKVDGTYIKRGNSLNNEGKGTWENKGDNLNDRVQTYIIDGVENEASFNEDFDLVTLTNKELNYKILLGKEEPDSYFDPDG